MPAQAVSHTPSFHGLQGMPSGATPSGVSLNECIPVQQGLKAETTDAALCTSGCP